MDMQVIIVAIIVVLAFMFVARAIYRMITSRQRNKCITCEDESCPYRRK